MSWSSLPDSYTVYGELKLSEKLQIEIYTLRDNKERLEEQVEIMGYKNRELERALTELSNKLKTNARQNKELRG